MGYWITAVFLRGEKTMIVRQDGPDFNRAHRRRVLPVRSELSVLLHGLCQHFDMASIGNRPNRMLSSSRKPATLSTWRRIS